MTIPMLKAPWVLFMSRLAVEFSFVASSSMIIGMLMFVWGLGGAMV
jgi:hypothetical protein